MKKLMIIALGTVLATSVMAEKTAGFQLSLIPDVAIQKRDTTINGVSIGVWNENPGTQWQAGFVNGATGESAGLQSFIFFPTFYNYAETYTGVQWAIVNYSSVKMTGWQGAAVNVANEMVGLQSGTVNYAKKLHGVQLGVVNYAGVVDEWAFQLGLVNIIADNPWFSNFPNELAQGFIIANWSFGGSK